jgi:uncharacterized protein YihD (DUF1040 family)
MYIKLVALALGLAVGCNNDPAAAQRAADKAQAQAVGQSDQVQADQIKAQAAANQKQAQATQSLVTAKEDQHNTFTTLLTNLDKREADLRAGKLTAKAADYASFDAKLVEVSAQRSVIMTDTKMLDGATADSWDPLKTRFDKDAADCRRALSPVFGKT